MQLGGGVEIVRTSGATNDIMTTDEFGILCSAVNSVEVISFTSAYGLIVRVRFNAQTLQSRFQLRSDINQVPVNELVLKCFIIQDGNGPPLDPISHVPMHMITKVLAALTGFKTSGAQYSKKTSTNHDADNEYETQKRIYNKTKDMSNPICPNALGLFKLNLTDFRYIVSNPSFNNDIFIYLGRQLEAHQTRRRVGILVMESIPSNYHALKTFEGRPAYTEMCKLSSAIYCISFALAGFILLDAHAGNWMASTLASGKVDVFALDVDKTINITSTSSLKTLSGYAEQTKARYSKTVLPKTALYLQQPGLVESIQRTFKEIGGDARKLWPPQDSSRITDNIRLIHKIFVLGALSECLTNLWGQEYGYDDCKIWVILGQVYGNDNLYNVENILKVSLDLDTYLAGKKTEEAKHRIIGNLQHVSRYIYERTQSRPSRGGATRKSLTRRRYKTNRRRSKKGNHSNRSI
jgi:hypothetical protein